MSLARTRPPVMIVGGNSAIALTIIRELGRNGVPITLVDKSAHALARSSRFVRHFMQSPTDRPLAQWLPDFISESGAKALFAVGELDLLSLADMPEVINGCRILTPRKEPLVKVLDKTQTLEIAQRVGVTIPQSWQPLPGEDFAAQAHGFTYPAVLKWSDPPAIWDRLEAAGLDFRKAEYVNNAEELLGQLSRYDSIGYWPLVQSWCSGYGFGQMLLMDKGRAVLRFQHQRLREFPVTGGVSTFCASIPLAEHKEQMRLSEALLAEIGWQGSAMVEYRHDPATGRYWLMEINGRFWGSLPLASQCGVPFAWEQYRHAMMPDEVTADVAQPAYPVRRSRFLIPDTKRLVQLWGAPASTSLPGQPKARFVRETVEYFTDFFSLNTGHYIWDRRDPAPFFSDMKTILTRRT